MKIENDLLDFEEIRYSQNWSKLLHSKNNELIEQILYLYINIAKKLNTLDEFLEETDNLICFAIAIISCSENKRLASQFDLEDLNLLISTVEKGMNYPEGYSRKLMKLIIEGKENLKQTIYRNNILIELSAIMITLSVFDGDIDEFMIVSSTALDRKLRKEKLKVLKGGD